MTATAFAQVIPELGGGFADPWKFNYGLEVDETWSDNINLQPAGAERSDFVTSINPSLTLTRRARYLTLNLGYSPEILVYARSSNGTQFRNALNATANATVIDNLLFVDAGAFISQQNISPFGTQAANSVNGSNNRTEARTYTFGPTLRSRSGEDFTYTAGYRFFQSNTDSSAIAGSRTNELFGNFQTSTSFRDLGIGANYDRSQQDYTSNKVIIESESATVTYVLQPTIHLRATGGFDRNRYPATGQPDLSGPSYSGGFDWEPSRHTTLNVSFGHRYFGPTANVQLSEATPRYSVSAIYSRDQTTQAGSGFTLTPNPNYVLLDQYFATTITDPVQRAQAVTATLAATGLSTSQFATSSFFSNQIYLQKRAELSVALIGLTNTVTFDVARTDSRGLSNLSVGFDIFNTASAFRSTSYTANWSHKLGPRTTVNATAQKIDNHALQGVGETRQRMLTASLSRQLSKHLSATALYRNVKQTGAGDSGGFFSGNYHENAVLGALRLSF